MFKLKAAKSESINEDIDGLFEAAVNDSYIDITSLKNSFKWLECEYDIKSPNVQEDEFGWGKYVLMTSMRIDYDEFNNEMTISLPEPERLNAEKRCKHAICAGRGKALCNGCDGEKFYSDTEKQSIFDVVSHPSHYTEGRKYEPRKVIADWGLNFNLGNAVKYVARAGRKGDKIEDLRKAIQYIEFEIEELTNKEDQNEYKALEF